MTTMSPGLRVRLELYGITEFSEHESLNGRELDGPGERALRLRFSLAWPVGGSGQPGEGAFGPNAWSFGRRSPSPDRIASAVSRAGCRPGRGESRPLIGAVMEKGETDRTRSPAARDRRRDPERGGGAMPAAAVSLRTTRTCRFLKALDQLAGRRSWVRPTEARELRDPGVFEDASPPSALLRRRERVAGRGRWLPRL